MRNITFNVRHEIVTIIDAGCVSYAVTKSGTPVRGLSDSAKCTGEVLTKAIWNVWACVRSKNLGYKACAAVRNIDEWNRWSCGKNHNCSIVRVERDRTATRRRNGRTTARGDVITWDNCFNGVFDRRTFDAWYKWARSAERGGQRGLQFRQANGEQA
jgi:hypothetical protein